MAQKYARDQPAGFTNRIERVAIVGASGQLGQHFTTALLRTGRHSVTALTRRGSTNTLPAGVVSVPVDYDDEAALEAALRGQQLGMAAVRARCAEIEATGSAAWITMVCGFWYEYSLVLGPMCLGFDHALKKVTLYDEGETKVNLTTFEQCARAVVALLSLKELPEDEGDEAPTVSRWRNKPLYVASFLVSQKEMLESWKRVTGEGDGDWTVESEPSEERYRRGVEMMQSGSDPVTSRMGAAVASFARIFYPDGSGDYESSRGLANGLLGLPKEDLDERTRVAKKMLDDGYPGWVFQRLQNAYK
ncbi:hypothetical protein B0I37DRAFT_390402 [Chaetomium sp. MPI-CAGE-AT-0009]|nr:hypothetical protein B0I37DRAFT_390402 [Chaetomium sp. MPI-CAGE-AT-0009]